MGARQEHRATMQSTSVGPELERELGKVDKYEGRER